MELPFTEKRRTMTGAVFVCLFVSVVEVGGMEASKVMKRNEPRKQKK